MKRRSATKSPSKRPEDFVWFIDRSLGSKIFPTLAKGLGLTVEVHDDDYAQDTPDEVWIAEVAARSRLIVTADRGAGDRVLLQEVEAQAATAIVLPNAAAQQQFDWFSRDVAVVIRVIERYEPPIVVFAGRSGMSGFDFESRRRCSVLRNGKFRTR